MISHTLSCCLYILACALLVYCPTHSRSLPVMPSTFLFSVSIHLRTGIFLVNADLAILQVCFRAMLLRNTEPSGLEPLRFVPIPGLLPLVTWVVDR
jgi:hypothetical protein